MNSLIIIELIKNHNKNEIFSHTAYVYIKAEKAQTRLEKSGNPNIKKYWIPRM